MSLFDKIKKSVFGKSSNNNSIKKTDNLREVETSIYFDNLLKIEISEQTRIAGLWKDHWREYLIEAHSFRQKYNKSCKCDVCGVFTEELFLFNKQTYCVNHLPVERTYVERKVRPGKDGSSQDFLKRVP